MSLRLRSASRPPGAAPSSTGPSVSGSPGRWRRSRGGSGSPSRLTSVRPGPEFAKLAYLSAMGVAYSSVSVALLEEAVRRVAVLGGNRIPFARSNSRYAAASNQDMLTAALDGLIARFGLAGQQVGEVVAGAVLKHSRDFNLTREVVLGSRLDPRTPAYDIQQACGTGLEAAILVANKIALGQIEAGVAGGVDTTSDAPLQVNEDMRRTLLEINRARTLAERLKAVARLRPQQAFLPAIPRNAEPRTGLSMGDHAAITALRWQVGREAQDELALASHQRLAAAYESGFFDDLVTPFLGLTRDQNLRADTTLE